MTQGLLELLVFQILRPTGTEVTESIMLSVDQVNSFQNIEKGLV
jgi:hypothetical protein